MDNEDKNSEMGKTKEKRFFSFYTDRTYDGKFLIIFLSVLALLVIAAVILVLCNAMNWYGFLIGGAIVLLVILGQYAATKNGLYNDLVFDYGIIAIPFALIGARVYFFATENGDFDWGAFFDVIGKGGYAVYGGLIGAVIGVLAALLIYRFFSNKPKVKFMYCMDLAFSFIPLGQAIGRWGCYTAHCCYGIEVDHDLLFLPFAYQPGGKAGLTWHLPTFLYESIFCAVLFVVLAAFYLSKKKSFNGFALSIYCIGYGACRFVLELFRDPAETQWFMEAQIGQVIPASLLVSIIIFTFGIAWLLQYIIRAKVAGKKLMILVPKEKLSDEYFEYDRTITAHPHVNPDGTPIISGASN